MTLHAPLLEKTHSTISLHYYQELRSLTCSAAASLRLCSSATLRHTSSGSVPDSIYENCWIDGVQNKPNQGQNSHRRPQGVINTIAAVSTRVTVPASDRVLHAIPSRS
jgi:hypothetical protein